MRFGTCNVGSIYRAGSLMIVMMEISKYVIFCGTIGSRLGQRWH
jgi:hypothetical protein